MRISRSQYIVPPNGISAERELARPQNESSFCCKANRLILETLSYIASRLEALFVAAFGRGLSSDPSLIRRRWPLLAHALSLVIVVGLAACTAAPAPEPPAPEPPTVDTGDALRRIFDAPNAPAALGILPPSWGDLAAFYGEREYAPLWLDGTPLSPRGQTLIETLSGAAADGLNPGDYNLEAVQARRPAGGAAADAAGDAAGPAEIDVLLSEALVRYAADLGGVPGPVGTAILRQASAAGDFTRFLDGLVPEDGAYRRLRRALATYRGIAADNGWQPIGSGPNLEIGVEDDRVPALRRRLAATGDLAIAPAGFSTFDTELGAAVRRFQARHGIDVDGVVGPQTRAELNRPVEERIASLADALRRLRVEGRLRASRAGMVNVPAAELDVVENGRTVLHSRVIVGRPDWPTPLISGKIRAIDINPFWVVPRNIARREILPRVRRDPAYLREHNIRVFSGWSAAATELDPRDIDWAKSRMTGMPFKLRQDPGPRNPLGRIKFVFDNPYDVYLHDTPHPALFSRSARTLSHGCIRVEKARDLALYLLRNDPGRSAEDLDRAIASGKSRRLDLGEPMPVYLIHRTAWVDEAGIVQFRRDPYALETVASTTADRAPSCAGGGSGVAAIPASRRG